MWQGLKALFGFKGSTSSPEENPPINTSETITPSTPADTELDNTFQQTYKIGEQKRVAFLDVETSGLNTWDRIISLGIIFIDRTTFEIGENVNFQIINLIFDPGRDCHAAAERLHGHSNWELRHQPFFLEHGAEIHEHLRSVDVIVAHNAKFDIGFLNKEFTSVNLPEISVPVHCTMLAWRERYNTSSSLANICKLMNLQRQGQNHGALEDAYLAMRVYFMLAGTPFPFSFDALDMPYSNYVEPPERGDGPWPPRKTRPRRRRSPK